MDFHMKSGPQRMDHPSRDPGYQRAVRKGQQKLRTMKFESEGQKRDYYRAVAGNENNVPGLPPFFPPTRVRSSTIHIEDHTPEERTYWQAYWKIADKKHQPMMILCSSHLCERITLHYISAEDCYCSRCGTQKPFRSVNHNS